MVLVPIPTATDSPTPVAPTKPFVRDGDFVEGRGTIKNTLKRSRPLASFGVPWNYEQRRDLDQALSG